MKKKNIVYLIILSTVFIVAGCKKRGDNRNMLTEEQRDIIEIADRKIMSIGVAIKDKNICYDVNNKEWQKAMTFFKEQDPKGYLEEFKLLDDRNYQAIHYIPKKKGTLGGSTWVFVDRDTKEVICVCREK